MKVKTSLGYDPIIHYTVEEIEKMYLLEGVPTNEARARAIVTKREIDKLNFDEQNLWRKVRKNERHLTPEEERLLFSS